MRVNMALVCATLLLSASLVHAAKDHAVVYTVTEQEDLQTVAGRYEVTVEDILVTNGITASEIEIGQVIYIPPPHATGYFDVDKGTYKVASGDDLYAISQRFGTTIEAVQRLNGMTSDQVQAGAMLKIPQS